MTNPALQMKQKFELREHIAEIMDFPKPGILFRDMSPLLRDHFPATLAAMHALFSGEEWADIDLIGGIESRGFILASGLAALTGKGLVITRKPGKLPGRISSCRYSLEYGEDGLEMQHGHGRLLLVDDVLATGGTLTAAAGLAVDCGYKLAGFACLINLSHLNNFAYPGVDLRAVVEYQA